MAYQEMIEKEMCSFAAQKGIEEEKIINLCKPSECDGEYCELACIEYVLAMTEYSSFMQLVADHRSCQQWEYGEELEGNDEE